MDTYSPKKWTVMVYLAGNNDLDEAMVDSLKGLLQLAGNKTSNIFAFYASANPLAPVSLFNFCKEKLDAPETPTRDLEKYRVDKLGGMHSGSFGSSASTETLVDFVKACHTENPTTHNVLILAGHSDAFLGRSLLKDETALQVMPFSDLRDALMTIKDCVLRKKLDILGFDSCAMAMIETAYELRETAKVLISPQDFTPSSGWNYVQMLGCLAGQGAAQEAADNPEENYAAHFVQQYILSQSPFTIAGRSVEISAIRLGSLETLVQRLKELSELLRKHLPRVEPIEGVGNFGDEDYSDEPYRSGIQSVVHSQMIDLILTSHWFSQTQMQDQSVDIFHFCLNLGEKCAEMSENLMSFNAGNSQAGNAVLDELNNISDKCIEIINERENVVIVNCYAGNELQFSLGLSLFFPWSRLGYLLAYDTYKELDFIEECPEWLSFINRFTAETTIHKIPKHRIEAKLLASSLYFTPFLEGFIKKLEELYEHRYDPPGRGALAKFRDKFGKVKNPPLKWEKSECDQPPGELI